MPKGKWLQIKSMQSYVQAMDNMCLRISIYIIHAWDCYKMDITKNITIIKSLDIKILEQKLGSGTYGKVYTVEYHGSTFAAKEIHEIL